MKIAIAVSGDVISGPGEAEEVLVYEFSERPKLVERYKNPALTAVSARGISMIKSVVDRGVETLIISGIGDHALGYAINRLTLLSGAGLRLEEAINRFKEDGLPKIISASHHSDGHHHH